MEKEPKEIKMNLKSVITIIILLVILLVGVVALGISALKPRLANENNVIKIDNNSSEEDNVNMPTEKEAKDIIEKYLNFNSKFPNNQLEELGFKVNSQDIVDAKENGTKVNTEINYSEFEEKMLKRVTKELLEENNNFQNIEGKVSFVPTGGYEATYTNVELDLISKSSLEYTYLVKCLANIMPENVEEQKYTIALTRKNDNFVVSKCEYIEDTTEEKIENDNAQSNNNENIQAGDNTPIEDIIEKFLNICATQQIPEAMLKEIGYENIYNNERKSKEINGKTYYDSGIKYSEVKARLLCYMTEDLYDEMLSENYKNIDGNLYCYRGDYVECTYTDTNAKYISSNGDIDKYVVVTTCNFSNEIFEPSEFEIEVKNRSVSKYEKIGVLKDNFGIETIEKHRDRIEDYIITGYALEDEIRKVSVEEFNKVKNGETIEFRNETWKKERVAGEELWVISDSGKYLALRAEEDYYVFSTVAGADKTCADYSNAYIKFTLPKDAIIKVTGGVDGSTTIEEFAKTSYKNRSGAYAEYTPIIENNSIIGFSCLAN